MHLRAFSTKICDFIHFNVLFHIVLFLVKNYHFFDVFESRKSEKSDFFQYFLIDFPPDSFTKSKRVRKDFRSLTNMQFVFPRG